MKIYSLCEMHGCDTWKVRISLVSYPSGMTQWLKYSFGEMNGSNYWTNYKDSIYFARPEDLMMFTLRWS